MRRGRVTASRHRHSQNRQREMGTAGVAESLPRALVPRAPLVTTHGVELCHSQPHDLAKEDQLLDLNGNNGGG